MSRRRGEFEHRTSIFEGAFRAWSHLGGLAPIDLETKNASELDPLTNPLENDTRLYEKKKGGKKPKDDDDSDGGNGGGGGSDPNDDYDLAPATTASGAKRQEYPYEPLPRSGLAHPFVQAILSPWLGPDADQDAIQLGLTTLRTWWQHRRKGESGSAVASLGADKMRGVVEGYTRHFFNLAHCLVTNDGEQPPRTLHAKMREVEKARNKRNKKKAREEEAGKLAALALNAGLAHALPGAPAAFAAGVASSDAELDANLTPLERLHAAQRRQIAEINGFASISGNGIDMRGKCVPGKIDFSGMVDQVAAHATQAAHRGALSDATPADLTSSNMAGSSSQLNQYGDPNMTPVVFVSENGDIQIAMSVEGITCAHCVKIVETVLRGCNGNKSPIDGLLDAAADRSLNSVLIKIDKSSSAKRIAFEAARNLSMVGYTAKAKEMSIVDLPAGGCRSSGNENGNATIGRKVDLSILSTAFEVVAATEPTDVFNWCIPCSCPDNGVLREDCSRHSQMNKRIFDAFDRREKQVTEYMAGCNKKYGGLCTCGPNCKCIGCGDNCNQQARRVSQAQVLGGQPQTLQDIHQMHQFHPYQSAFQHAISAQQILALQQQHQDFGHGFNAQQLANLIGNVPSANGGFNGIAESGTSMNRNSIASWGAGFNRMNRNMSVTSETTFGRAMSGLSALSIDWENMEDFDVDVDHSAHINNAGQENSGQRSSADGEPGDEDSTMAGCNMLNGGDCDCGPDCVCVGCPVHDKAAPMPTFAHQSTSSSLRRSSMRKNTQIDPDSAQNMQVSFKI